MKTIQTIPVATIIVVIIAIVGGVVVVTDPHTLSFEDYIKGVGVAVGLLAVGRGLDSVQRP